MPNTTKHRGARHTDRRRSPRLTDMLQIAKKFSTITFPEVPPPRLNDFQSRFLCAVIELGDHAYQERIKERIKHTHTLDGEEVNDGYVSNTAKVLKSHDLITARPGGMPSGKGRPVTIYSVTKLGERALRYVLEYIEMSDRSRHSHDPSQRPDDHHDPAPTVSRRRVLQ